MTKAADQTIRALQDFITDWVGPAAARVFYEPGNNSYNRLRESILKLAESRTTTERVGYAVFSRVIDMEYDRDRPSGFVHKIASAVFEKPGMAENVIEYWSEADCGGKYIICEILEHRP